jgi:hypothetical protein
VDIDRAWLGNWVGIIGPTRTAWGDANGDSYEDLILFYPAARARALIAASLPEDGPLGLHYEGGATSDDFLVVDVFALGAPVPLPVLTEGPSRTSGNSGARSGGSTIEATPEAGAVAKPTETTIVQSAPTIEAAPVMPLASAPAATMLLAPKPNPFSNEQTLTFSLTEPSHVSLAIFDVTGARVKTIVYGSYGGGTHSFTWTGRNDAGRPVPAGVYIVKFDTEFVHSTRKTLLAR